MNFLIFKRKIKTFCSNPKVFFTKMCRAFEPVLSDELFLKILFRLRVGYWPNIKEPKSYNEKLQWFKLYYKRPEYTQLVDKVAAKDYVANIIGDKYIIPTLGVWNSVDEIDWNKLPNQFVLKAAHDSGGIVVCKDKSKLDIKEANSL